MLWFSLVDRSRPRVLPMVDRWGHRHPIVEFLVEHLHDLSGNEKAVTPAVHFNVVGDGAGTAARVIRNWHRSLSVFRCRVERDRHWFLRVG